MQLRSAITLLLVNILGAGSLLAQPGTPQTMTELLMKSARLPKTSVEFSGHEFNFGNVKEEAGTVSAEFRLKNLGPNPLIIVGVEAGCECTVADYPRDTIKIGQTGVIKALFTTTNRPGPVDVSIAVYLNEKSGNMHVLSLKGNVIPREPTVIDSFPTIIGNLRFSTSYFAWGSLKSNSSKKASIGVYNQGTQPIRILSYTGLKDYVSIKSPVPVIQPGQRVIIEGILDASKGAEIGLVTVFGKMVTDDTEMPEKDIHGSATVEEYFPKMTKKDSLMAPRIGIANNYFNFGEIREGTVITHDFEIKNSGKKDLIIRKLISSCGCTVAEPEKMILKPGESIKIKVTFDSQGKKNYQSRTVNVIVNDPASPNNPLTLTGNVID